MKVKDLERTANIAWSPAKVNPIYLAAGTAAQQLDASFNTNASLEIFSLNLSEPGMEMEAKASIPSEQRFHKLIWGAHGGDGSGTIVGGCDGGIVDIYNADKVLKGESALISRQEKHKGPVHSLDFNPFQANLLATGAAESEIYIWDMNNTTSPMTPGAKSQPFEDVLSIQWNRQVQHILASTFSSKCVVWDLRKNEPIIKLSDTVSRIRWKVVAWHPDVATQLCLASEEDQAPVIQLWDLRFATSPLKTLQSHQRGVLSMAWCMQDPDLLISCAKDNRIVCWNPNSTNPDGEILSEVARTNQWNFDISWCPKNPALIATPGFDGHVSVYSIMGGKAQQIQTTNKIADSFPGMEGYADAPMAQQTSAPVSVDLSKPPKWLKKPVGATFGFGGKLFSFEHEKNPAMSVSSASGMSEGRLSSRMVHISQVVTEMELIEKSNQLEQAVESGNFIEYCKNKADSSPDQHKRYIWYFLKANFEQNPRAELLNLLGYKIEDVNTKLNEFIPVKQVSNVVDPLADAFADRTRIDDVIADGSAFIPETSSTEVKRNYQIKTGNDTEGLIVQALLMNNIEAAVELCMKAKRFADAIIIAMTGGSELLSRTQNKYLAQSEGYIPSLISALIAEDWASVINNCDINSWREALAAALTHASDEELPSLCELMGTRLEQESGGDTKLVQEAQLCYICAGSFEKLVGSWSHQAKISIDSLQELVELVTFLQKSVERQGRNVEISGNLADLLSKYAFLLASQGSLNTALNYLGRSPDERVTALKERLYVALGHKPAYGQAQPRSRQNTARSSIPNFTNTFRPPSTNNFAVPQFNAAPPQPAQQQPWQMQQPAVVRPVINLPPARPDSVGATRGTNRSRYVVDPSVQSNHYGSRAQYQSPQPSDLDPNPNRRNFYAQDNPYGGAPIPDPIHNNQFPPPVQQPYPTPIPNVPPHQIPAPVAPVMLTRVAESLDQEDMLAYIDNTPGPFISQPTMAAPGWNDPPMFRESSRRPARTETPPHAVAPITHPIFGAAVQEEPSNGYEHYPQNNFPPTANMMRNPPPIGNNVPHVGPVDFATQYQQLPPARRPEVLYGAAQEAAERVRPPIPEQHIHMQTVFNELRNQCRCAANNPQTKRKIEDVGRKLEILYDLLRDGSLTSDTLTGLHNIVQRVQNGDYQGGLSLHQQLVSGPDFSQIGSFMPGLKVLLQCAIQLQVYL